MIYKQFKQISTLQKALVSMLMFGIMFFIVPFFNHILLKADLFSEKPINKEIKEDIFFYIKEYNSTIGETGEIEIISNKDINTVLGFSFDLNYPHSNINLEGLSTKNTILDGKNFYIQKNNVNDGKISIVGATGGDGTNIKKGDTLLSLTFFISQNTPNNTLSFPLDFSNMKIIKEDMKEIDIPVLSGKIDLNKNEETMDITNIDSTEKGNVKITFSNLVKNLGIKNIQIEPSAIVEESFIEIDKEFLLINKLNLISGEEYKIIFKDINVGKNNEKLNDEYHKISFIVPYDGNDIFKIIKNEIISDHDIKLFFSDTIKEESVNLSDFISKNFEFESFKVESDKKSITLKIKEGNDFTSLIDPELLNIRYIESTNGQGLVESITDIFKYENKGSEMKEVIKKSNDEVIIYFKDKLDENSIKKEFFEILEFKTVEDHPLYPNKINDNTKIKLSEDFEYVTLSNLELDKNKKYLLMIKRNTIKDKELEDISFYQMKPIINDINNNFDKDFFIESVTPINENKIELLLSKEPKKESIKNIYVKIIKNSENIRIKSVNQDKTNLKKIYIETENSYPNEKFFLLLSPELWETNESKYLGGKNTQIFTFGEETLEFKIDKIEPYRIKKDENQFINLTVENIPESFDAYINNYKIKKIEISNDKKSIKLFLPEDIIIGNYNLEINWINNNLEKNIKKSNAFIIEEDLKTELKVISEKSYASPNSIPNNGNTTTNLYVFVDDERGLEDLEKVTVDLREIDQEASVPMLKGEIENGMQVWFLKNITVPETVATKEEAYKLPVVAQNKSGMHAEGFVYLFVSRDETSSIPPKIINFSITPNVTTPEDSTHPLLFNAEIKDEDGGEDITTVAVNLSSIQKNTIFLTARNTGQESSKTRFFENTDTIVVPESVENGVYPIILTVIDAQGEESKKTIELTVKRDSSLGPVISEKDSYLTPSKNLLKNDQFTFKIHTKITDPSGAENIENVSVNLSELGLEPEVLKESSTEGRSKWFISKELKIPETTSVGKKSITITAYDKEGNENKHNITVEVLHNNNKGSKPIIHSADNYITPNKVTNNGKDRFSAYVFVEDKDDDISHVILKLGNTALFIGDELPKGTSNKDENGNEQCISTRTILCMKPIIKEANGQWYYLSDLVIINSIKAREKPYSLDIIAVDKDGTKGEGTIDIIVTNTEELLETQENKVLLVQSSSENEVKILFENTVEIEKVQKSIFKISSAEDSKSLLNIKDILISPDGKIVTIKTDDQIKQKNYSLKIDSEKLGLKFENNEDTVFFFSGYDNSLKSTKFKLVYYKAVSPTEIHLKFTDPITVNTIMNSSNISIFKQGKKDLLGVLGLYLYDKNTISIKTSKQNSADHYDLFYKNIESIYGSKIENRKYISVQAYQPPLGDSLAHLYGTADFNGDGVVDFKDFTLFAAVYGKKYEVVSSGDLNGDNKIDFKDFTMFSSYYGDIIKPEESTNNSNIQENNTSNNNLHGAYNNNINNQNSNIPTSTPFPTSLKYSSTPKPTFKTSPSPRSTSTPFPTSLKYSPTNTTGTSTNNNSNTTGTSTNNNSNTTGTSTNNNSNTTGTSTNNNSNTTGTSTNNNSNTTGTSTNNNSNTTGTSTNNNSNTTGTNTNNNSNTTGTNTNNNSNTTGTSTNNNSNTTGTNTNNNSNTTGTNTNNNSNTTGTSNSTQSSNTECTDPLACMFL
jgi:hypothetical protein